MHSQYVIVCIVELYFTLFVKKHMLRVILCWVSLFILPFCYGQTLADSLLQKLLRPEIKLHSALIEGLKSENATESANIETVRSIIDSNFNALYTDLNESIVEMEEGKQRDLLTYFKSNGRRQQRVKDTLKLTNYASEMNLKLGEPLVLLELQHVFREKYNPQFLKLKTHHQHDLDHAPFFKSADWKDDSLALQTFLNNHLTYPDINPKFRVSGEVEVEFLVQQEGSITHIEILHALKKEYDDKALEVIKKLPKFTPATKKGQPVASYYRVKVLFK